MSASIRPFRPEDWAAVWPMLRATFATGDTYAFAPDSSEAEIRRAWIEVPLRTYVACAEDGTVLGTYYLKPNQPGLGAHVCNCGYIVAPAARGRGIAAAMCEHSQREARTLGFRAMQFNLVVASNEGAIRLWQKLGFRIVGTLPGAFHHAVHGDIDAHVMFKALAPALVIEQVDAQGKDALALVREAAIEMRAMYPEQQVPNAPWPTNAPTPPRGVYLIGYADGAPVACGALRPIDEETAEVRRIFVTTAARRSGHASAMLVALERAARGLGYTRLRLETGNRQHAAMALYEARGFARIAPFGEYRDDPTSICFEKVLELRG